MTVYKWDMWHLQFRVDGCVYHMGVIWSYSWNNLLPLSLRPFVIASFYIDRGVPYVAILLRVIILQAIMNGAASIIWQSNECLVRIL